MFACSVCVLCLILYFGMEKTAYYKYYSSLAVTGGGDGDEKKEGVKMSRSLFVKIVRNCWVFLLALLFNGVATSSIYPASTSLVEPANPTDSDWHQLYFTQARLPSLLSCHRSLNRVCSCHTIGVSFC